MEEIKLPKFKTKEELEQFAMGLMTENETLRLIIMHKDSSIGKMSREIFDSFCRDEMTEKTFKCMKGMVNEREKDVSELKGIISELEAEIKSLKENISENKYKKLYEEEHREHIATKIARVNSEYELDKIKRKVHKLCSMVTFMLGLLPRFKVKRVKDAFGEFNIADYRL
jgi:SMC interacting uncharacterized protein involved in chromosome segregation